MSQHVESFLEQTDVLKLLTDCDAVAGGMIVASGGCSEGALVTRPLHCEWIAFQER